MKTAASGAWTYTTPSAITVKLAISAGKEFRDQ